MEGMGTLAVRMEVEGRSTTNQYPLEDGSGSLFGALPTLLQSHLLRVPHALPWMFSGLSSSALSSVRKESRTTSSSTSDALHFFGYTIERIQRQIQA